MNKPTISELWHEVDGLIRLSMPHLSKLVDPAYNVDEAMRPEYRRQLDLCNERLAQLRTQILELCESFIPIGFLKFTDLPFGINGSEVLLLQPEFLDELSAVAAFWAWELRQREKERTVENG